MPVLITDPKEIRLQWADINNRHRHPEPKHGLKRSSGYHLSGVTKYVLETSGLLTPRDRTDEFPLCMAIGMAWEAWAVGLWPEMDWQPGECHLDQVYGSPDGLTRNFKKKPHQVEEFKATWKSGRNYGDILKQKMWLWQGMGYCKMMKLRQVRYHILFINGSYPHGAPSPVYATYEVGFSQLELDWFWNNVVLPNRDKSEKEIH